MTISWCGDKADESCVTRGVLVSIFDRVRLIKRLPVRSHVSALDDA